MGVGNDTFHRVLFSRCSLPNLAEG